MRISTTFFSLICGIFVLSGHPVHATQGLTRDSSFQLAQLGDCEEIDEALETVTERLAAEIKILGKCVERSHGKNSCGDELDKVDNDGRVFKNYINRRHPECK